MPIPYPSITKIPNTGPAAVPDLWNSTYLEIDANFEDINDRLSDLETGAVRTLSDLSITVSAATINYLSGVTGNIQTQLNGKMAKPSGTTSQYVRGDGSLATFPTSMAPTSHSHAIGDVSGLQAALNAKMNTPSGSASDYVRGDGVVAPFPTGLPPGAHTHAISDVTGLQAALDGKLGTGAAAASAAKLSTARTITVGATSRSFDGSNNIGWTLGEIGAAGLGSNTYTGTQSAPSFSTTSSRRVKTDIADMAFNAGAFDSLRPVTFAYTFDPDTERMGLIAEEVAELYPEAVRRDIDGNAVSIDYNQLVPVLIAAVQDLRRRVAKLEGS